MLGTTVPVVESLSGVDLHRLLRDLTGPASGRPAADHAEVDAGDGDVADAHGGTGPDPVDRPA